MRKIAHFPYPRPHRTTLYKEPRGGASRPERRKDRSGTGPRRIYAPNARRYNRANDKQTETDGMIREFHQIDLSGRNSFGVGQQAARLAEFETEEDLRTIFSGGVPERWAVLSGGNNILFTRDYDGLLLTPPVQNIGAYGCEAKDVIERVHMFCTDNRSAMVIDAGHCCFGYRESIFKHELRGRVIITAVDIRLSRTPRPRLGYGDVEREVEARGGVTLRNIREAICAIRRAKLPDPKVTGNAGSFFKNPVVDECVARQLQAQWPDMPVYPAAGCAGRVKLAAGWLIDKAGLKGYKRGRVGVHERQALVLVNLGGATGGEVIDFAHTVQMRVHEKFGIEIDTEVNIF